MSKNHSKLSYLTQTSNPKSRNNTLELAYSSINNSHHSEFFADKSMRFPQTQSQRCKVIKLIGDKENNIEEIITEINCYCGSKREIRNILQLLMSKIYKLRQERNSLKDRLSICEAQLAKLQNKASVGINTEDMFPVITLANLKANQQLFQISSSEKARTDRIEHKAEIDKLQELFKTEEVESLTFQRQFNQTNLLQESEVKPKIDQEDSSLLQLQAPDTDRRQRNTDRPYSHTDRRQTETDGRKVLGQHKRQPENRLKQFSQFLKVNKFDINTLQSYIQKINCAKEIGKYQLRKRNKDLF